MGYPTYQQVVTYNQGLKAPLAFVLAYCAKYGDTPDSMDHYTAFVNQLNAAASIGVNPMFFAGFLIKNGRFPSDMPGPATALDYFDQFLNDVSARDPANGNLTKTASQSFAWLNSYFSDPAGHPGTFFYPPGSTPATVPMGAPQPSGAPTAGSAAPVQTPAPSTALALPTSGAGWLALIQAHKAEAAVVGAGLLLLLVRR